jgi:hypothetical protein
MSELKYWIADRFFTRELDEAFRLGVKAGTNQTAATIAFRVGLKRTDLTKTEAKGYDKALKSLAIARAEVVAKVGEIAC